VSFVTSALLVMRYGEGSVTVRRLQSMIKLAIALLVLSVATATAGSVELILTKRVTSHSRAITCDNSAACLL
jgi:hypothetical protein